MVDSSFLWIGLIAVFVAILIPIGLYNSESAFLERVEYYGITLEEINRKGLLYQEQEKQAEFEAQAELMQKNLGIIASDALNLKVTPWPDNSYYFPLRDAKDIKVIHDQDFEICEVGTSIPLQLYEISKSERFKIFAKKYSKYPITIDIMDERNFQSVLHYSLSAKSGEKYASTWFHVSTCTNQITDEDRYPLYCSDESTGYRNNVITEKDFMASIEHDEFCIIPLSPWRQSLLEYSQEISSQWEEVMEKFEETEHTDETIMQFHKDMQQWDLLQEVANAHYQEDVEKAESKTKQYIRAYGDIPQDLLEIIEKIPQN